MYKQTLLAVLFICCLSQTKAQPGTAAPTPPSRNVADVKSLFSGAYTNIVGTDWFPNWGQTTVVSDVTIAGNATKKYANLNYQGVQFASAINVTAMNYLHIDLWTANCNSFDVYLINTSPVLVEQKITLTPSLSGWNSYDLALTQYNTIALASIDQFKFVGTTASTVYLDNIYFYRINGKPPVVSITAPTNNTTYAAPASFTIKANASDSDGTVKKVAFYKDATLLGVDSVQPYTYNVTNVFGGTYAITARATDNAGLIGTSAPVNIVVTGGSGDGYCGTAVSNDYKYKIESAVGNVTFTFHPLTPIIGCAYSLIYIREGLTGGYAGTGMTAIGGDFTYTKAIADSTPISVYFTYQVPSGGERNSSLNPHSYKVGTNCTGLSGVPTVTITSPLNNAVFTEPANFTIKATAVDNGPINRVDFLKGASLLGTDASNPYTYNWVNAPAGNYTLAAKVTDNDSLTGLSPLVKIVVNINNSMGFCGTIANGDYSYRVETINGNAVFTFHPLTPIAGCAYVYIYVREGLTGLYPGYQMTGIGSDFRFTKAIANGTPTSIYFTYQVPSGGERNSSATPHTYSVGTNCLSIIPVTVVGFGAARQSNGSVAINWSTLSEVNNDHFLIEKSIDAQKFSLLSTVSGYNYSSVKKDYRVIDELPVNGNNYYRLTQVDKDGKTTLYGIVVVKGEMKNQQIFITPNPSNGVRCRVNVKQPTSEKVNARIVDITGKILLNKVYALQNGAFTIIPATPLQNGTYLLMVDGFSSVKLVVSN